jgi:two-component system sensor histidine kinase KdpD
VIRIVVPSGWYAGYLGALGAVGVLTGLVAVLAGRLPVANLSMLYLLAVLPVAGFFGSGPAILAAVAAVLSFNWFFVEPTHTFVVADPNEWVALLLFLVTAIVTGQLAAGLQRRAGEAHQREREAIVLHDVMRLMAELGLNEALRAVAERLRHELRLAGAVIDVADGPTVAARAAVGEPEALKVANSAAVTPSRVMGGGIPTLRDGVPPRRWIRVIPPRPQAAERPVTSDRLHIVPVQVQGRRVGSLLLVRPQASRRLTAADERLVSIVAAQLGPTVERLRLRQEATEAEILRRTDELKDALLNAVSHDLRTPLASIIAAAGSLAERGQPWTEEQRIELAETIEQEARRLNRIVGNLLDLSRLAAGGLQPDMGWYDLGALVDDVVGRLRSVTSAHRVVVDVPESVPPVWLDALQIDQVLSNLVENAVKHTPPGTQITISAAVANRQLRLEVADTGPGIPEPALPHLFDSFFRGTGPGPRPRGTGLGLAVARRLVEAHGGTIWAENRASGGARFVVALPMPGPPVRLAEPAGRAS